MRCGTLPCFIAALLGIAARRRRSAARTQPAAPATRPQTAGHRDARTCPIDRTERMTVPVSIGGQGPYGFIVDTGAERTVIARELARRARSRPGPHRDRPQHDRGQPDPDRRHSRPRSRRRTVTGIHAPALARRNLGAEGHARRRQPAAQRVVFDFARQEMTIIAVAAARGTLAAPTRSSSPAAAVSAGWCSSTPRSRASGSG